MTETSPMTLDTGGRDRQQIVDAIVAALSAVLTKDLAGLTEDTKLVDELGLDSTAILELIMEIEERLDIEFDSDGLEQQHLETIGTLTELVSAQVNS